MYEEKLLYLSQLLGDIQSAIISDRKIDERSDAPLT